MSAGTSDASRSRGRRFMTPRPDGPLAPRTPRERPPTLGPMKSSSSPTGGQTHKRQQPRQHDGLLAWPRPRRHARLRSPSVRTTAGSSRRSRGELVQPGPRPGTPRAAAAPRARVELQSSRTDDHSLAAAGPQRGGVPSAALSLVGHGANVAPPHRVSFLMGVVPRAHARGRFSVVREGERQYCSRCAYTPGRGSPPWGGAHRKTPVTVGCSSSAGRCAASMRRRIRSSAARSWGRSAARVEGADDLEEVLAAGAGDVLELVDTAAPSARHADMVARPDALQLHAPGVERETSRTMPYRRTRGSTAAMSWVTAPRA